MFKENYKPFFPFVIMIIKLFKIIKIIILVSKSIEYKNENVKPQINYSHLKPLSIDYLLRSNILFSHMSGKLLS